MLYKESIFILSDLSVFQKKALAWASTHTHCSYFNPCGINFPHAGFTHVLFAGAHQLVKFTKGDSFKNLQQHVTKRKSWLTGYFSYELKNEVEQLCRSEKLDLLDFDDIAFYEPENILFLDSESVRILSASDTPEDIFNQILKSETKTFSHPVITLESKISHKEYIENVNAIKLHIEQGNVYELNFCMEFFHRNAEIEPVSLYDELVARSPAPFSVFQKMNDKYLLSCSPERFIRKKQNVLISQPIKGTAPRGKDLIEDHFNKEQLFSSEKERSENLMIVDLVRNDLARTSITGTTKVEELFGIYSFAQVHQMISTITSKISDGSNFIDSIKYAFPMGSMTGAPKISAMRLIEKYESSRRGLFSGSVGYISPEGDFDFNVVIRSLLYNSTSRYLSLQVGSAITYDADPEKEYAECLLKAKVFREVLSHS